MLKCGTVAVVGKANAGKSTLINVLVGEKVAIVSPKPQTTRDRILGILTEKDYQIVFEDTPGFYKSSTALNKKMQKTARRTVNDVDVLLFVIDCHDGVKEEDLEILKSLEGDVKMVVAISKIDIMPKENVPEALVKIAEIAPNAEIIPISARKGRNIKELKNLLVELLPKRQVKMFSEDVVSDKSEKFMIAEIMREKILLLFDKEIPHGIAVIVNEFSKRPSGTYEINLDIVCEKQNHKSILIGKQGSAIKKVSSFARESMEKFLGAQVFLTTYVKVKENWRDKENLMAEFGYGDLKE